MNRVFLTAVVALSMVLVAQDSFAGFGRKCGGGGNDCGGGLFSRLGSHQAARPDCGGGLFARLKARKAADCCTPAPACAPAPTCCEPAPAPCCEPAPAPCCEPAPAPCCEPAPSCCTPAPSCGGCGTMSYGTPVYGSVMSSGCANCSTTMDGGVIMSAPSMAPPAPAPVADPAADAPVTGAPEA